MGKCQIIRFAENEEDHLKSQPNMTSLCLSVDWMDLMIEFSFSDYIYLQFYMATPKNQRCEYFFH